MKGGGVWQCLAGLGPAVDAGWLDGGNGSAADAWPKFRVAERELGLAGVFSML